MNTIACCLLTHNHPAVIKEVLDNALLLYSKYNIDICVYDDSDNHDTLDVVNSFICNGYSNLFYIDASDAVNVSDKYLKVIRGIGLPQIYDYIWLVKDRCYFGEITLKAIREAVDYGHDVILAANENTRWSLIQPPFKDTYTDPVEFYRYYAYMTANWECTIRKVSTMLAPINWEYYKEQYNVSPEINFNQTITTFVRLAELQNVSIKIIREYDKHICHLASSGWKQQAFEVWIDQWIDANCSLPAIYEPYMSEAIQSETALPELFGSGNLFISLKQQNIYSEEVFNKYLEVWPIITDIPTEYLHMIAIGDYKSFFDATFNDFKYYIASKEYPLAYRLFTANSWLSTKYNEADYSALVKCFLFYKDEINKNGFSLLFRDITSIDQLLNRFYSL